MNADIQFTIVVLDDTAAISTIDLMAPTSTFTVVHTHLEEGQDREQIAALLLAAAVPQLPPHNRVKLLAILQELDAKWQLDDAADWHPKDDDQNLRDTPF